MHADDADAAVGVCHGDQWGGQVARREACERVVRGWEEVRGLTDDELRRLVGALGDLPQPWASLPPASLGRVVAVISSSSHEELLSAGAYGRDVSVNEIEAAVDARIAGLGLAEFHQVVSRGARPAMLNRAMELLEEAGNFRTAETAFACLVPLAPFLDIERLQRLIQIFKKPNGQVRRASDVPPYTEMVFDSAPADAEMVLLWVDLATWLRDQADDPDEYYAYPGLYERVHR